MKTLETSPEIITFVDRLPDLESADPEMEITTFVDRPQDPGVSDGQPEIIAFEDRPQDLWENEDAGITTGGPLIITTPKGGPFGNGGINPGGMYTVGTGTNRNPVNTGIPSPLMIGLIALGVYLLVKK